MPRRVNISNCESGKCLCKVLNHLGSEKGLGVRDLSWLKITT